MLTTLVLLTMLSDPKPGEYLAQRGRGQLTVTAKTFHLWAFGANGHTCELEGSRTPGGGKASEGACAVSFVADDAGVTLKALDDEPCRSWCGARAWIEDRYFKMPPACLPLEVTATRTTFKGHYDRKQWAQAKADLQPVLERCAQVLDFEVEGWLRNDLALTLHHLEDDQRCLKVLEPLRELASRVDDELMSPTEPAYEESYRKLARASATNLGLCSPARKGP
jgi:hypothetical protein